MLKLRLLRFITLVLVAALGSCTGAGATPRASPAAPTTSSSTLAASAAATNSVSPFAGAELVGEWQRDQACAELIQAYEDAGLEQFAAQALVGIGFLRTPPEAGDPNPCNGAIRIRRSHLFSADGTYAGLDPNGEQVDGDRYRVTGSATLEISDQEETTAFRFKVDGRILTLAVIWPDACSTEACLDQMAWAVETFALGPWRRVGP